MATLGVQLIGRLPIPLLMIIFQTCHPHVRLFGGIWCLKLTTKVPLLVNYIQICHLHMCLFGGIRYLKLTMKCLCFVLFSCRRVVSWVRSGGAAPGPAHLPGRQRRGPAGGDHQGPRHALARADTRDEPQLHRIQIPTD